MSLALLVSASCNHRKTGDAGASVKSTDLRVSEGDFGPMLGEKIVIKVPGPGKYVASYQFSMHRYPTREIYISSSIRGHSRLELMTDGSATACFAVKKNVHSSESRYSSYDGKDHYNDRESRALIGAGGKWLTNDNRVRVVLDRTWRHSCELVDEDRVSDEAMELDCILIEKNDRLPVTTLACKLEEPDYYVDEISMNTADSPRSGPFAYRNESMDGMSIERGNPWILMGAEPGLHVKSEDGRRAIFPGVTFTVGAAAFLEEHFIPKPFAAD